VSHIDGHLFQGVCVCPCPECTDHPAKGVTRCICGRCDLRACGAQRGVRELQSGRVVDAGFPRPSLLRT
jgi:hypothetical protein